MHQYGVRDIEKLLGLRRSAIRALIKAGFVTPQRGPRDAWRFSFQDLIVLRTAQALSASLVPYRRITKALKELRRNLPDEMPLSGLRIAAVGDIMLGSDFPYDMSDPNPVAAVRSLDLGELAEAQLLTKTALGFLRIRDDEHSRQPVGRVGTDPA